MLTVHSENVGDTAVLDCEGKLVGCQASYDLQEAVISQLNSKTVVLDLTGVYDIDDGGLDVLLILQKWALNKDIQLKLFNPKSAVRHRLRCCEPLRSALATFTEIVLLAQPEDSYPMEHAKAA